MIQVTSSGTKPTIIIIPSDEKVVSQKKWTMDLLLNTLHAVHVHSDTVPLFIINLFFRGFKAVL